MASTDVSRAIKLVGTEQPDVIGRILRAGPVSVEFDNGNLRYIKLDGVEVLRALAYLVRDENWGTYTPTLSKVKIEQRDDSFSVSYHAVCSRPGQSIGYDASIEGGADGSIKFRATAKPDGDFLTARTGFVVLHPLKGIVDRPVKVEFVDGKVQQDKFPRFVNPVCPFTNIRELAHEVRSGIWAHCRMEGEAFEMEDHRNWTDASFKTYVRPLAKPWPYTLPAGEAFDQSVSLRFKGPLPAARATAKRPAVSVKVGAASRMNMPLIGIGMPAEEASHALSLMSLLKAAEPRFLVCHYDPRANHGVAELNKYRKLCEQIGADCVLEVVVQSLEPRDELIALSRQVAAAGLRLAAIAVCPVGDLKSVLPGGKRPPAPELEKLYAETRSAFPRAKLGGGMFSFFTELNRKQPPADELDFVINTTCPVVHAADDRSVMETLEALPHQVATARTFVGEASYRVGPSAIGCRDNPHGATYADNANNERVCLAKVDPRQRALFGAAWMTGYIAAFANSGGAEAVSVGAPSGALGLIYRSADFAQPYYDQLDGTAVYPMYHVVAGLARASGQQLIDTSSSDVAQVVSIAYRTREGQTLWLANLTRETQTVRINGFGAQPCTLGVLDEHSFALATTDPVAFRQSGKSVANLSEIELGAYAVAFVTRDA